MGEVKPVTVSDVRALAAIIEATHSTSNVRVRRLVGSDVVEGVARSLVTNPDRPATPDATVDLRDCYLHVTNMFEHYWPVRDLITEYHDGLFAVGD